MIISRPVHSYGGSQGHVSFCLCPLSCIWGRKWHYTTLLFKGDEQQAEAQSHKSTSPEKETRLIMGTRHRLHASSGAVIKKRRTGRLMCRGSDTYTKSMALIFGPKHQYVNVPIRAWRGKASVRQRDARPRMREMKLSESENTESNIKTRSAYERKEKGWEKKPQNTRPCRPAHLRRRLHANPSICITQVLHKWDARFISTMLMLQKILFLHAVANPWTARHLLECLS